MSNAVRTNDHPALAKYLNRTCLIAVLFGCFAVQALRAQAPNDDPTGTTAKDEGPTDKNTAPADATPAQIRAAVARAVPPLEKGLVVYAEKRDCYSCHNQGVPLVALSIARSRGLTIDDDAFEGAVALALADLESARDDYRQGRGQPGGATRASYALWTLEVGNQSPNKTTAAVVEFLLKYDRGRDHWTKHPPQARARSRRATSPRRLSRSGGCERSPLTGVLRS